MRRETFFLLFTFYFAGCSKEKLDHLVENPNPLDQGELSSVRIVNAAEYLNVIANGDTLTNFATFSTSQSPQSPFTGTHYNGNGTPYFPYDGLIGREWRVPKSIFRENGRVDFYFQYLYGYPNIQNSVINYKFGMTIQHTDDTPVDYYLGINGFGTDYFQVERSETPSASPEKFRIRVVNLAVSTQQFSLTWADGEEVDPKTSNTIMGQASEYIELPYGTYQFRVLTDEGYQIPGAETSGYLLDPNTLSIEQHNGEDVPSTVYYIVPAPIHTYLPGGVYTLYIYPSHYAYFELGNLDATKYFVNAFRVIQDNTPQPNLQYCRIQGFNALPGQTGQIRVNQESLYAQVAYGELSDSGVASAGETLIEFLNEQGNPIATTTQQLQAGQNYTVYAYPDPNGDPELTIVANDFTAGMMPFQKRFINLCPDIPYATFTTDDGSSLGAQQSANLQPGIAVTEDPYVEGDAYQTAYEIMAFRSAPGLVPGIWADDIPVLQNSDFVANEEIYATFNGNLPAHEPGYYTVALIGRTGDDVPEEHKAKMVIIKHNK